ncbi:hypothetical protein DVH05_007445 [Phytophthora capsici]|nr:hypothetical protein DVH05_007445 [Phytophthora capsici]
MLAGFVVPHAHYRVFHGDPAADSQHAAPNDQFPLALSPRRVEAAPTDLHLREFAQLEVQVKALQLQVAQHASPKAMGQALAGSLAECFLFYSRLLTVESFPWPDFLAAVFTKMAEHFATSENEIVRSAILRVFQRARAHLAQVNDPSKLLGHLSGLLMLPASRTLTLQMLATMPSLLVHDTSLQEQILKGLSADDRDERSAAVEAARAFLPFSTTFRKDILTLSLEEKSTALCSLLADSVSNAADALQAWTHCAELYERLVDDKSVVASLRAMTTLTGNYLDTLLEVHGQLLYHVLDQDPRAFVRNFTLLATQQLVINGDGDHDQLATVLESLFSKVTSQTASWRVNTRITLSALLLLEKWSSKVRDVGENAKRLLSNAKNLLATATDERFGQVYTAIITNIARQKLSLEGATSPERSVDELLLLLHPRAVYAAKATWNYSLKAITRLSQDHPQQLANYVATRLIELLSIPADSKLDPDVLKLRRTLIFMTLGAQLRPPTAGIIHKELPMLLKELALVEQADARRLRAVAATIFLWTQDVALTNGDGEVSKTVAEFERELLNPEHYENHAERYEMAKLAMLRGRFALAAQLLDVIAAKADSECFGGWLQALHTLCEAESRIAADHSVHLDSLHLLTRTSMYLQAARTSSFRFGLQLHFVALRLEWLQLLQNTQQLAGESAFTNSPGNPHGREGQLSSQLRTLASKFGALRSLLLGADQYDLNALQAHTNLCNLLASAVEGFLLLRAPNSIDFPTAWGLLGDNCQWTLQLLKMMSDDVQGKLDRVAKLSPSRQPGVGARVLQQLLAALCALPPVLPKLFFCSRLRNGHRLLSSAQFLTYAENAAFTAKPRSRSQLGVPIGTDFTSVLKGVLAMSHSARTYWRERSEAVEVEVLVCTTGAGIAEEEKVIHHRVTVALPIAWDHVVESCAEDDSDERTMMFLPFETPVHVKAANLATKGSFALVAKLAVVDNQGDRWPLAATGCRRGFIVY